MEVVRHPHVAALYDAVEEEDGGYLVMEFVEGGDLKQYVHQTGSLPCTEVLQVGMQMCLALQAIHERGIVHCDVKPHNILRSPYGWVKLTDFGIASLVGARGSALDRRYASTPAARRASVGLPGTPIYCAPEQALNADLSPATDLYSLGVVLYELLAGEAPFVDNMPLGYALAQADEGVAPTPLHRLRGDIPPNVELVISQALEKDPCKRFADAATMCISLAAAESGLHHSSFFTAVTSPLCSASGARSSGTSVLAASASACSSAHEMPDTSLPAHSRRPARGEAARLDVPCPVELHQTARGATTTILPSMRSGYARHAWNGRQRAGRYAVSVVFVLVVLLIFLSGH